MARILVVEDDDYFRTALAQVLTDKKHTVFEASNGLEAQDTLTKRDIDIIISDVQMPQCNGIELLEWAKTHKPTFFILMTGFTNLLETKSAYELGADEFLAKPFRNDELMGAIARLTEKKNAPSPLAPQNLDGLFLQVSIEEFVSRQQIEFDIYARLSEEKYVRIGSKDDLIPRDRIYTYRDKGIDFLHIRKEDFAKLVNYRYETSRAEKAGRVVTPESRAALLKLTNNILAERVHLEGLCAEAFQTAREFVGTAAHEIIENPDAFELLRDLQKSHPDIYEKSVSTAVYAVLVARAQAFSSSQLFFKLTMAGFFHQIGKQDLAREIFTTPAEKLSEADRKLMQSHPCRSREILSMLSGAPSDVLQMVYEHCEDNLGQGYPMGRDKNELHPLSKILIVANRFAEAVAKNAQSEGLSAPKALKHLASTYGERLDRGAFEALTTLFSNSK